MSDYYCDGGYGNLGNISTYLLLHSLPKELMEEYRDYLKNTDQESYEEYLKYENG